MTTELELSKQSVPISKLEKYSCHWVLKVLVISRGPVTTYKKPKHEGAFQNIILIDNEGTKIQTTLFNTLIEKWKDFLQPNKTYYIINGRLDAVNPNYSSVHKEVEIAFTENTIVRESNKSIPIESFSNRFITLDDALILEDGSIFDVVCILATVKPVIGEGRNLRREIIVTNGRDHTAVTLWREFAESEGEMLQNIQEEKPILGLCDVKVNFFRGNFGIATIPVSKVLINPDTHKASDLRYWRDSVKTETKEISLSTSTTIRKIKEVQLGDIVDGILADAQDSFYRFTATISELLNLNAPWYCCCNKCFKKVHVIDDTSMCPNCKVEKAGYKKRYCLRIQVTAAGQSTTAVLFEAATSLVGCTVTEYIHSISEENEESKYYQKLLFSLDKKFAFVGRIDQKKPNSGSIIVEEIHPLEEVDGSGFEEGDHIPKRQRKNPKKHHKIDEIEEVEELDGIGAEGGDNIPIRQRKNPKKFIKTEDLQEIENVDGSGVDREDILPKRQRKKPKKYSDTKQIHDVEDLEGIGVDDGENLPKRQRKTPKRQRKKPNKYSDTVQIHDVEALDGIGDDDGENLPKRKRKTPKKYNEYNRPTTSKKIKVEKE